MDPVTRRNALTAGAAPVLVACSDADAEALACPPEYAVRLAAVEQENRAVAAWVEENRGALPTDYDELARLPSAYRLAAFIALPPVHKSAIMQEHLRRAVAARPEMTRAQREVIQQAQQLFVPAWYEGQHEMRVAAWQGPFGQRVENAFSRAECIRIFGSIGPEDDGIRARVAEATAPPPPYTVPYDELMALPREHQAADWAAAAPAKKAGIERGHFEVLAASPGVTAEQREALREAAALVSPDWYEPGAIPSARDEVERLLRRAFGADAVRVMTVIRP